MLTKTQIFTQNVKHVNNNTNIYPKCKIWGDTDISNQILKKYFSLNDFQNWYNVSQIQILRYTDHKQNYPGQIRAISMFVKFSV